MGEPFKEVSPGFLPRTLAQLRAGVANDARRPENRLRRRQLSTEGEQPQEPTQSLDSALDSLIAEASDEETPRPSQDAAPTPTQPQVQTDRPRPLNRGEARLQRARERFARVFGTREDIQQDDYESPLSTMYNRAYDRYRQAEERRATDTVAPPTLEGLSVQERREIEEQLLWGVMRESASHHELPSNSGQEAALYGLLSEGNVWSYNPINRWDRASERSRLSPQPPLDASENDQAQPNAPATRAETNQNLTSTTRESTTSLGQETTNIDDHIRRLRERVAAMTANPTQSGAPSPTNRPTPRLSQIQQDIQQLTAEINRVQATSEQIIAARYALHARTLADRPIHTLDNQPGRPNPCTDQEMTRTLACQVCYQQLADIAVLPCGHMVMCQWCADVVIPVRHSHIPVDRASKCPMCRKVVKQRFKIHLGS